MSTKATLQDLTRRWEGARGRELKVLVLRDLRGNKGRGLSAILRSLRVPYVDEVPLQRDLRCITLEEEELEEASLERTDLSWANLAGCELSHVSFKGAKLRRANLSGANLAGAIFDDADCYRLDLTRANLAGASFARSDLTGAVFEEAFLEGVPFSNANLKKANLRGANVKDLDLTGVDCSQANFTYGALNLIAVPPDRSSDVQYDLDREAFEDLVGLKGQDTRRSGKYTKLRRELKSNARQDQEDHRVGEPAPAPTEPEPQPESPPQPVIRPRPTRRGRRTSRRVAPPPLPSRPQAAEETEEVASPLAPFDADAPEPSGDWALAVGQLMRLKGTVTKIVVELGDRSRFLYRPY